MWWIIIIAIILILFIIGFVARYRHYVEEKANKSRIYHALSFDKGSTLDEIKEKLGPIYDVVSKSGVLLRIRYRVNQSDIDNYKKKIYKDSKYIQMDFDREKKLLKVEVI